MARIRTIKPEFWTDESITECSLSARLLFIGTWNFADDKGNLDRSAKQIKARVFPIDAIDCEPLIQELITHGLLTEYEVNSKTYLHVTGFEKHQLINRPSAPTCPQPIKNNELEDGSRSAHGELNTEGKGKEGKGINPIVRNDVADDCPHQEIINLYHKHLPTMTQVKTWTAKRASALKARWRENKRNQTLDFWERFFVYVSKSDFLTGKSGGWDKCDLEWLIKSENFVKVIEGKYENKAEVAA